VLFDINDPTNKLNSNTATVSWHFSDGTNDDQNEIQLKPDVYLADNQIRRHPTHDIAVIRLMKVYPNRDEVFLSDRFSSKTYFKTVSVPEDLTQEFKDINIGDEIYLFGYPSSIGLK
jgi:hypothetical protein